MILDCIQNILEEYTRFEQVKAVAVGGSSAAFANDNTSDIDIYVFVNYDIPVAEREILIKKYSSKYEAGGEYFGAGDEFYLDKIDKQLDVMFWNTQWFEDMISNVWIKHQPSNGYTSSFLYTLKVCKIFYDKEGWLYDLKNKINTSYPDELKQNIIKRNMMLLKDKPFASYYEQIEKAVKRNDLNSINHRISAFMASYFDVIFAKNELLHPGEKRLVKFAKNNCKILPESFEENITNLFKQPNEYTLTILNNMIENLRKIL